MALTGHKSHAAYMTYLHGDNARIREEVIRSGDAWITSTLLKGERVLRVTMINPRTQREHVDAMLGAVRRAALPR